MRRRNRISSEEEGHAVPHFGRESDCNGECANMMGKRVKEKWWQRTEECWTVTRAHTQTLAPLCKAVVVEGFAVRLRLGDGSGKATVK